MTTKRELFLFSFYDHTGITRHLEAMAAKGWMLEHVSTGTGLWRYRKVEPKKLRFAVTYFPKASQFDAAPGEGQQSFLDYCEAAGWTFVAQSSQMQIFCTEAEDPVPLDTEPTVQVENIHRAMKANYLIGQFFILALALFYLCRFVHRLVTQPLDFLCSASSLSSAGCMLLLLAQALIELFTYFRWHRRAQRAAEEEGRFLPTRGNRWLQAGMLWAVVLIELCYLPTLKGGYLGFFLTYLAVFFLCIGAGRLLQSAMKKGGVSTGVNRAVTLTAVGVLTGLSTFVLIYGTVNGDFFSIRSGNTEEYTWQGRTFTAYCDDLPLSLADLTGAPDESYSRSLRENGTFLLREVEAYQRLRHDASPVPAEQAASLSYNVWTSPLPALLDLVVEEKFEEAEEFRTRYGDIIPAGECEYVPADPAPWGAESAFAYHSGTDVTYLLRWENRVALIVFASSPTLEQMATAAGKLTEI